MRLSELERLEAGIVLFNSQTSRDKASDFDFATAATRLNAMQSAATESGDGEESGRIWNLQFELTNALAEKMIRNF